MEKIEDSSSNNKFIGAIILALIVWSILSSPPLEEGCYRVINHDVGGNEIECD